MKHVFYKTPNEAHRNPSQIIINLTGTHQIDIKLNAEDIIVLTSLLRIIDILAKKKKVYMDCIL